MSNLPNNITANNDMGTDSNDAESLSDDEQNIDVDTSLAGNDIATCVADLAEPQADRPHDNLDEKLPLIRSINHPGDLRKLDVAQLPEAARQLRQELIDTIAQSGGHFGASLGVIELTIALHYVFNSPVDRVIWDIGHQAYPHKIITGRRQRMASIRKLDGISGFPTRSESHYDAFGVAHAGTSVSAGIGMAIAASQRETGQRVVAVIGDGALTEGMAFEALNHAGTLDIDLLIVYNDNNMSISPNVGSLNADSQAGSEKLPGFFHALGCDYSGPVDGHDVPGLLEALQRESKRSGVRVLHVKTIKGKGYEPAEKDAIKYHAVSPFNADAGMPSGGKSSDTYTSIFSRWICDSANTDDRVVAITPAMREGSGLVEFEQRFPDRYFDVGIAEQHAVTMAGGMACEGFKPVVAIYSTFLQRGYDQLIHDIALQNLDVLFAVDRGGLVGADGPTHHGSFDLSYARCVPNLIVMAPSDEQECRKLLQTGLNFDGPSLVRYPRGSSGIRASVEPNNEDLKTVRIGKALLERRGHNVALLAFGPLFSEARKAAEVLDATLVNMRFIKPLDVDLIRQLAASHDLLVTIEDNALIGGAGSAVSQCLHQHGLTTALLSLGLPDQFVPHGSQEELLSLLGLDADGIIESVNNQRRSGHPVPLE